MYTPRAGRLRQPLFALLVALSLAGLAGSPNSLGRPVQSAGLVAKTKPC